MPQIGVQANPLTERGKVSKPRTMTQTGTLTQTDRSEKKSRAGSFIPKKLTNTILMIVGIFLLLKFTIFK